MLRLLIVCMSVLKRCRTEHLLYLSAPHAALLSMQVLHEQVHEYALHAARAGKGGLCDRKLVVNCFVA